LERLAMLQHVFAQMCSLVLGCVLASIVACAQSTPSYPWSQRGRDYTTSSFTPYTAPNNFSGGPSWVWLNDLDEQVRHSPLIDHDKNIYVMTGTRIRKFSSGGAIIWTWHNDLASNGLMVACPALYKGAIYAMSGSQARIHTVIFSLSMDSGKVNWKKSIPYYTNGDSSSVFVYNDTIVVPFVNLLRNSSQWPGNSLLHAASTSDGHHLWDYAADDVLWNFAPSTPGDGTLVFAGQCGGVFRVAFGGHLIWRKGPQFQGYQCSCGGGALGNGVYYVEYTISRSKDPGAHLLAYRVSDGAVLWQKKWTARYQGWQYPAVGKLGPDGPLAVVAAIGTITGYPTYPLAPPLSEKLSLVNAIVALDAATGKELWRVEEDVWPHLWAAGDEQMERRLAWKKLNPEQEVLCLPDTQGIPLISGDGTVYASSSHTGDLRAINDRNGNGVIEASEISIFHTGNCFLNSPSLASGMLVAAPCWGPMYVFNDTHMPGPIPPPSPIPSPTPMPSPTPTPPALIVVGCIGGVLVLLAVIIGAWKFCAPAGARPQDWQEDHSFPEARVAPELSVSLTETTQ